MAVSDVVQAVLFSLFAVLTGALWAITAPTYDYLLVPELQPAAAYPAIFPSSGGSPSFLSLAAQFSAYLVANVVDPAVVLVVLALGAVYLARAVTSPTRVRLESLLPRLVVAIVLANVTVPVAGAILEVAGATYPVVSGFDGGAWQSWANLTGIGGLKFAWDNGILAFVLSFALFSLVLLLALAIAARNAMLAVLLVLLPAFSLLAPIPVLEPLARRSWLLFGELAFLPVVVVIPLELAVGSPSMLVLVAYLAIALGAPSLINVAGGQLGRLGFPSAGGALTGGVERGLAVASVGVSSVTRPLLSAGRSAPRAKAVQSVAQSVAKVPIPFAAPLLAAEGIGRGAEAMFRHVKDARLAIASRRFGGLDPQHPERLSDLR
ncbi:MAG: hypothetical protein L3K01_02715 [Thermoplasmata archaeon]|nr:hypothetical protein [Thermoplasmata archaeon]MCI4332632.1 hypothetical protein [Thermoplasmata archaeon]